MRIYVGNMPFSADEAQLTNMFRTYGTVDSVNIVTDRDTGRAKGFGFVEMNNQGEANAAIEALNGSDCDGRKIVVNEARPREERPARSGGSSGGGNRRFNGGGGGGNRW